MWSDALHDTGDCLVLGLAWYLQRVAMKGRDARFSYGYGRFSMLGGWLTSVVLIVGAVVMSIACLQRILEPVAPHAPGMMLIAAFGLLMNGLAAWWLHGGDSLNERGAYLHLLEDVLGWAAVLIGAVLIQFTGWSVIDPLLGIGISLFIAWNAVRTLRQGTGILMQEVPAGVDERSVRAGLMTVPHVLGVHDQHTWTLDGRLIVHDTVTGAEGGMGALRFIREILKPLLANKYKGLDVLVIIDPAAFQRVQTDERCVADIFKAEGFTVRPAKTNAVAARLGACESYMTRNVGDSPALSIAPGNSLLIQALAGKYRYKINTKGETDVKPEKSHPWSDVADSFQYLCLHADGGGLFGGSVTNRRREIKPAAYAWT